MNEKKLYGRWYIWEELVRYPMMLYYWIKGDKIKKLLSERIRKAKYRAEQEVLTEKTKNEFLIEYEKLDNFFSYHFKEIIDFLRFTIVLILINAHCTMKLFKVS